MIPYVAPFVLYLTLTQIPSLVPGHYALAYCLPVLAVGLITLGLVKGRGILKPHPRVGLAVITGAGGVILWIGLSSLNLESRLTASFPVWLQPGDRAGFNPFETLSNPALLVGFLLVRITALAILVPVAEELFWRGFLLRWIASKDWRRTPIGRYTPGSFLAVTFLFALAHPEWIAAALYSALLNWLIYRTRDLWSCVIAHATSNLLLAGYILVTRSWYLW